MCLCSWLVSVESLIWRLWLASDSCGVQLPPSIDLVNEEQIVHQYYRHCCSVVKQATGADLVVTHPPPATLIRIHLQTEYSRLITIVTIICLQQTEVANRQLTLALCSALVILVLQLPTVSLYLMTIFSAFCHQILLQFSAG